MHFLHQQERAYIDVDDTERNSPLICAILGRNEDVGLYFAHNAKESIFSLNERDDRWSESGLVGARFNSRRNFFRIFFFSYLSRYVSPLWLCMHQGMSALSAEILMASESILSSGLSAQERGRMRTSSMKIKTDSKVNK